MSDNLPSANLRSVSLPRTMTPKWYQVRGPKKVFDSKALITLNNMPSNIYLKSLNKKPHINIRWRSCDNEEPILLYEFFPKPLAEAFSGVCRAAAGNSILITGIPLPRVRILFSYLLDCAKGEGCSAPPLSKTFRYCNYSAHRACATILDVPLLIEEFNARCKVIEQNQVHSEDVRAIYSDPHSKGEMIRTVIANSIANKLFTKTLKAYPCYVELRASMPEFDEDVKAILKELRRPEREEQARIRKEHAKAREEASRARQHEEARGVIARRHGAELRKTGLGIRWVSVPIDTKPAPRRVAKAVNTKEINNEEVADGEGATKSWADEVAEEQGNHY